MELDRGLAQVPIDLINALRQVKLEAERDDSVIILI
jgi:hypothetical protein